MLTYPVLFHGEREGDPILLHQHPPFHCASSHQSEAHHQVSVRNIKGMCTLGQGPRQKNGKILMLRFLLSLTKKNYFEKVWKSRNKFKLVGFKVEKKWHMYI